MKVLFVKTHSIGDVLLTTSALQKIQKVLPEAEFFYLTSETCSPVLESFSGIISYIHLKKGKITALNLLISYISIILKHGLKAFDISFVFLPNIWTVLLTYLLSKELHCFKKRGKFTSMLYKVLNIRYKEWKPRGEYILRVYDSLIEDHVQDCGDGESLPFIDGKIYNDVNNQNLRYLKDTPYIAVFLGGGHNIRENNPYKRLDVEKSAELIKSLYNRYDKYYLVIGGSRDDDVFPEDQREIFTKNFNCRFIMGDTDIHDLIAVIKYSRLIITTDSLPLHIAVALRKNIIALFGPTDEKSLLPERSMQENIHIVRSSMDCSPCYANETFRGCKKKGICMEKIDIGKILDLCDLYFRKA